MSKSKWRKIGRNTAKAFGIPKPSKADEKNFGSLARAVMVTAIESGIVWPNNPNGLLSRLALEEIANA